ncbi:DNA-directed RNA polymerase subunit omega [Lewinella sp. 4G2]|uniref:DNA-directed RNA polymerase subunit omega n=1 Tax=Lewinella sp. 4G2 TaxID=1803372 RepID=UPI0007B4E642|nr:DNA-directed RNA polymerase subunit omega [Lewinella sp. 4G2]OAV44516.1 DNA-directed RNA polymerase subunit omega [Lewinella sp. 4G2]
MSDIKARAQGLSADVAARDIHQLVENTGNIYETLAIVSRRGRQLSVDLKHELDQKLEEFAEVTDTIEEVVENKEQIEISKFYEKLPNPVLIAMREYLDGELYNRYNNREDEDEEV